MIDDDSDCVRCGGVANANRNGYCDDCHWLARAEVEEGFFHLRRYLAAWARFRDWELGQESASVAS
jgi:hypothetical protein